MKNIMKNITRLFTVPLMLLVRYHRSVKEINTIKKHNHRLEKIHVAHTKVLSSRLTLLERLPKGGVVAEVGVATGDFSKKILATNQPQTLHLVDYWKEGKFASGASPESLMQRLIGTGINAWEVVNEQFTDQIEAGTVKLHRGYSWDELAKFDDGVLDWIYIDAAHNFDSVSRDLLLAKQKVKHDGIIAGHDYVRWGRFGYKCGVVEAVNSFCKEHGYEFIYITLESHTNASFAIRKITTIHSMGITKN